MNALVMHVQPGWREATPGLIYTHASTGTPHARPKFWVPPDATLAIPDGETLQARPAIVLDGGAPGHTFMILIGARWIDGTWQGHRKRMVAW